MQRHASMSLVLTRHPESRRPPVDHKVRTVDALRFSGSQSRTLSA